MGKGGSRIRRFIVSGLLMVGLGAAIFNVFPFRQTIAQNRAVEEARIELEGLQAENERLERDVKTLQSPGEIERIARADYGYVRPGDTSYVIVGPAGGDSAPEGAGTSPEPEAEPEVEAGGFWSAVWGFITGRDLTDG